VSIATTPVKRLVSPAEIDMLVMRLVPVVVMAHESARTRSGPVGIWGVPRGGVPVAMALSGVYTPRHTFHLVDTPQEADVIVDDIYDSGATARYFHECFPDKPFVVLIDKRKPEWRGWWVVLPWEVTGTGEDRSADDIVTRLLEYIGEDPNREGLQDTPRRVLAAWKDWAQGYRVDPMSVLKTFQDGADGVNELVIVHNIPIISKCEHHLADITGVAHVGYIPDGKIVGLSKIPRLVDVFARRLQVQERLTNQIADALVEGLQPHGVGVVIRAAHACMSTRGVKIQDSVTTTSAMRGALLEKGPARQEFLDLCRAAEGR
jgi:GTP cyclohydrolase I